MTKYFPFLMLAFYLSSCGKRHCERHYIDKEFIGRVSIYYNQDKGQRKSDKEGCREFNIPNAGKCYSGFEYVDGLSFSSPIFKFFEVDKQGKVVKEIPEFTKNWHVEDVSNDSSKYVFFEAVGWESTFEGRNFLRYDIDYGYNYFKYLPTGNR